MKSRNIALKVAMGSSLALFAFAGEAELKIPYRYVDATDGSATQKTVALSLPAVSLHQERVMTDPGMARSLYAVKMAKIIKKALVDFELACPVDVIKPFPPITIPKLPTKEKPGIHPPKPGDCLEKRVKIAEGLVPQIDTLRKELSDLSFADTREDEKTHLLFKDYLKAMGRLSANMKKPQPKFNPHREGIRVAAFKSAGGVTGGGAQDAGHFRDVVNKDGVPGADDFVITGFISEFHLPIAMEPCSEVLCVKPALTIDPKNKKIFVQIGKGTKYAEGAEFKRRKLNLSVVLDISGSMQQTDKTEKSRLEWAKDALRKTVDALNEDDVLSIVLFESEVEVLREPSRVMNKEAIKESFASLVTKGSTALYDGLRKGYEQVKSQMLTLDGDYEHRVMIISDAGANQGVTEIEAIDTMVTNEATAGIGLTALGLGLDFNEKLTNAISDSRGGGYYFIEDGAKLDKIFEGFDFLASPIAYDFSFQPDFGGFKVELVDTYGIARKKDEKPSDVQVVKTLFLVGEGGGAEILEYNLP